MTPLIRRTTLAALPPEFERYNHYGKGQEV